MTPSGPAGAGPTHDDEGGGGDQVFGYASLLTDVWRPGDELAVLRGYRRTWNVATDNTRTLPGYKIYLDPLSGERPPVFVTFLNLVPDTESSVAGVLFSVDQTALATLDLRERNYRRADVSSQIEGPVSGRVWTYLGSPEAEARFAERSRELRPGPLHTDGVLQRVDPRARRRLARGPTPRF